MAACMSLLTLWINYKVKCVVNGPGRDKKSVYTVSIRDPLPESFKGLHFMCISFHVHIGKSHLTCSAVRHGNKDRVETQSRQACLVAVALLRLFLCLIDQLGRLPLVRLTLTFQMKCLIQWSDCDCLCQRLALQGNHFGRQNFVSSALRIC